MRDILARDVQKKRNQTNAITLVGQFYSFLTEIIFISLTFAMRVFDNGSMFSDQFKEFMPHLKFIEFGLLCSVQVMTSQALRNELKSLLMNKTYFIYKNKFF